jgi:hypothetical protein
MKQRRVRISTSEETKQMREKSESSREDTRVCLPALSARSWRVDFPSLWRSGVDTQKNEV